MHSASPSHFAAMSSVADIEHVDSEDLGIQQALLFFPQQISFVSNCRPQTASLILMRPPGQERSCEFGSGPSHSASQIVSEAAFDKPSSKREV